MIPDILLTIGSALVSGGVLGYFIGHTAGENEHADARSAMDRLVYHLREYYYSPDRFFEEAVSIISCYLVEAERKGETRMWPSADSDPLEEAMDRYRKW